MRGCVTSKLYFKIYKNARVTFCLKLIKIKCEFEIHKQNHYRLRLKYSDTKIN